MLKNGNVLVAGGDAQRTSEIYVPDTDTWSSLHHIEQTVYHDYHPSTPPDYSPAVTLLKNGNVLIAGGADNTSCTIYTPG